MTKDKLTGDLAAGRIIPLSAKQWDKVASVFPVVDRIATHMAGDILLVKRPLPESKRAGWAIVEDPEPGKKVIRPLDSEKEARALIADRLAAYERMWDG